jgi:hypothetical protein
MPKYKVDIRDLERGYPNAQPVFRGDIKEKGFVYVTGANIFVAENKAEEIWKKSPKKYGKKLNGTTSCVRKKGRY